MPNEQTKAASTSTGAPQQGTNPLQQLEMKILSSYKPELWLALRAGLAVIGSLSLKERAHPLALIFEGASGRGKSFVINMCEPDRAETESYIYRLDAFTPKSFVSHAANVSRGELEDIDLLPKIKDKTLLTKELAPLFRGREEELRANFATLTAVLDGRGHISASGSQGTRGYHGRFVFNWLGATTPIPQRTDAIMAQLGNRLLRYEIIGESQSEEALMEFAKSYSPTTTEDACRKEVNDFFLAHFSRCPLSSVDPSTIRISEDPLREIVRLARLIAQGRVEVECRETAFADKEFIPGTPEGPERIILLLRTLAQGLALVCGGTEVTPEDLEVIRHVSFSSLPRPRRQILRALLTVGGELTSAEAQARLYISRPTIRGMMKELAATGIVNLSEGKGTDPDTVTLASDWAWLLTPPAALDAALAQPPAESKMQVCAAGTAES